MITISPQEIEQSVAMFRQAGQHETRNFVALTGVVVSALVGIAACSSDQAPNTMVPSPSSESTAHTTESTHVSLTSVKSNTSTTEAPSTTEDATSTTETSTTDTEASATPSSDAATATSENTKEIAPNVFEATDIGEHPCGPKTDQVEIAMRLAAGEVVVKPGETFEFLNNNPKVEQGLNDFWTYVSKGDTAWIDYLNEKPVKQPEILGSYVKGTAVEDSNVRGLKARMDAKVSTADLHIQNFSCDPETGKIYPNSGPNGKYNNLPAGTQFWTIELSKEEQQDMKDKGIKLPESLVMVAGADGALEIIMERALCNNPLLELPPVETPPTPTPTTEKPTPTTSTPPTTTPPTTTPPTSTTTPQTTVPPTTTPETTIPEESTTTSSTMPDKVQQTPTGGEFPSTTNETPDTQGTDEPTTSTIEEVTNSTGATNSTVYNGSDTTDGQTPTSITSQGY